MSYTTQQTATRGLEIIENIPADRHGTPSIYCFILNCSSSVKMSGPDKKQNNKHFYLNKLQSYTMQLSLFRCSRRSGCFSVIPEIFHDEEYNQPFSDSGRTKRCYVRFTQIILNTFCMLKQEEIHSCKEL